MYTKEVPNVFFPDIPKLVSYLIGRKKLEAIVMPRHLQVSKIK